MPIPFPLSGGYSPAVLGNFAQALNDYTTLSSVSSMPPGGAVSRAGNAMLYDSTGKLTWAPNNQYINSGSATNTARTITTVAGVNYYIWIQTSTGTATIVASGTNTTTFNGSTSGTFTAFTATAGTLTLTPTSNFANITQVVVAQITYETALRSGDNYVTGAAAYYGPRFDYDPVTLAAKGLLVEGTRTNYRSYSSDFTQTSAWTKLGSCTVNNTTLLTIAPDGTNTAQAIVPVSNNSVNGIVDASGTIYSSGRTVSFYAKAGTGISTITGQDGAGNVWTVNLSNGSSTFPSVYTYVSVTNAGNGWYRVAFNTTNASFYIGANSGANGSNYFSLWGVQVENGAFVTSFIPTVATGSIARAAETLTLTGYTNRLVEAFYIDEQTNAASSYNVNASSTSPLTIINTGTTTTYGWGWYTSLRAYTNAYAGDIATPSWLSFSRAGNAMYYDSTGALTWAPANLALYSQQVTNAAWTNTAATLTADVTTAPDGTSTADKLAETTANSLHGVATSTATVTAGSIVCTSAYLKAGEIRYAILDASDFVAKNYAVLFDLQTGTVVGNKTDFPSFSAPLSSSIQSVGNGWYRCAVIVQLDAAVTTANLGVFLNKSGSTSTGYAFVGTGTTDGIYIWGAQLERVTYQQSPRSYIPTTSAAVYQPRYDYDASTTPATPRGLLIEESRSNLLTYSQPTVTGWSTSAVTGSITFSSSDFLVPTGQSSKAAKLAATATSYLNQALTFSATTYSYSFYAKSGAENTVLRPQVYDGVTDHSCLVNFTTLVVSSVTNLVGTPKVTAVGNGWYRIEIVFTVAGATTGEARLGVLGAGTAYFYGAQLEVGAFSTSYMGDTTTGSPPATRAADVAQLTGSALTTLQGTQMTLAAEAVSSVATNRYLINARKISGGNYGDYYSLGSLSSQVNVATVNQATLTYSPAPTTTSIFRAAFAIQANNFAAVANNGTVQTDGTGSIVTGIDQGWLGGYSDGVYLNGYVRSMALYNQRLPDAILRQKSTVGSPY
jgi:hypothetical protein